MLIGFIKQNGRGDVLFLMLAGIFLCLLLVLFALTTWLVLYPGPFAGHQLQLHNFLDMDFKMLLVAVAALNFLVCFLVEVSEDFIL